MGTRDNPRIKEVFTTFYFQVNGQVSVQGDEPDEAGELRYAVLKDAYAAIERDYRKLESAERPCPNEDFKVPAYELCENDVLGEEHDGQVVTGVGFWGDETAFTKQALYELKWFVIKAFNEAAEKRGVPVAYAGCKQHTRYEFTETTTVAIA